MTQEGKTHPSVADDCTGQSGNLDTNEGGRVNRNRTWSHLGDGDDVYKLLHGKPVI